LRFVVDSLIEIFHIHQRHRRCW